MGSFSCQLDMNSESRGKRELQQKKCPCQIGLWSFVCKAFSSFLIDTGHTVDAVISRQVSTDV